MLRVILSAIAIGIFSGLPQSSLQAQPSTNPSIFVRTVYYQIIGSTANQLRSQMNQLAPISRSSGKFYDANTQWYVSWNYRYRIQDNQCRIGSAKVKAIITITLPQWNAPANATKQLKKHWIHYLTALRLHEDGHKHNGIKASSEILKALENMPVYSSCQELGKAANNAGDRIIKKYNQQDISYDRETKHGVTQGAVFP